ncbi:MAG: UDP-N-acetylmuramate dehydrogenase [Aureispira sp.]
MPKNKHSLQELHTFGMPIHAQDYIKIQQVEDLLACLPLSGKFLILGGGSNVLFTQDFEGCVLHNQIKGIEVVKEEEEAVYVRVGGGEVWHDLVEWCLGQGYSGIENLSLIPGSVGAAPIQNIGAYGVELKDVFYSLEGIELATGTLHQFVVEECAFGYRDSVFKRKYKGQYFITKVTLRLPKQATLNFSYGAIQAQLQKNETLPSPKSISEAVIQIRQQKLPDPKQIGNAGSFFKNPIINKEKGEALQVRYPNVPLYPAGTGQVKLAAGWLIDQLGWKGYRKGDAGVHAHQALVLVNHGQATGAELWALAQEVQASVQEHFGILLEPEVNIIS